MKKSIGTYLEEQVESGAISENQVTYYYDRNRNIQWVGRAAYCPVYLDRCELKKAEIVGNELRVYEGRPEELTENKAEVFCWFRIYFLFLIKTKFWSMRNEEKSNYEEPVRVIKTKQLKQIKLLFF